MEPYPPDTAAVTVKFPQTDTSPVKTMTILQNACTKANVDATTTQSREGVTQEIVNSVGSGVDSDINVYCEDKLQSPSEGELQTLVEVSEE